jgi:hypothetical protein
LAQNGLAGGIKDSPSRILGTERQATLWESTKAHDSVLGADEILKGPTARSRPTANWMSACAVSELACRIESLAVHRPDDAVKIAVSASGIRCIEAMQIGRIKNVYAGDIIISYRQLSPVG